MSEIKLIYIQSGKEEWSELAQFVYSKKLSHFFSKFEIKKLKTSSSSRDKKEEKIRYESQKILKLIHDKDYVVVLDEKGLALSDSIHFSKKINSILELQKQNIIFIIGGAFGLSDEVKQRANSKIRLSDLTMSHHVAQVVLLEQIYRSMMIINKTPYHNV